MHTNYKIKELNNPNLEKILENAKIFCFEKIDIQMYKNILKL